MSTLAMLLIIRDVGYAPALAGILEIHLHPSLRRLSLPLPHLRSLHLVALYAYFDVLNLIGLFLPLFLNCIFKVSHASSFWYLLRCVRVCMPVFF